MIIWRLTTKNKIEEAFDGEGASKQGGRWNSQGTKMIYCSESVSLCILENLVHFDADIAPPLYLYEIEINESDIKKDPATTAFMGDESQSKKYGDNWVSTAASLALEVPSVIVDTEKNYLINPSHNQFKKLKITILGPFDLDSRLTK